MNQPNKIQPLPLNKPTPLPLQGKVPGIVPITPHAPPPLGSNLNSLHTPIPNLLNSPLSRLQGGPQIAPLPIRPLNSAFNQQTVPQPSSFDLKPNQNNTQTISALSIPQIPSLHLNNISQNNNNKISDSQKVQNITQNSTNQNSQFSLLSSFPKPSSSFPFTVSFATTIRNAPDNSIIEVPEGEYKECIIVTKPLFFKAKGTVKLQSKGANHSISICTSFASFEGFDISISQTSQNSNSSSISISDEYQGFFKNCQISSSFPSAISINNKATILLDGCTVKTSSNYAVTLNNDAKFEAINSTFSSENTSIYIKDNSSFFGKNLQISSQKNENISFLVSDNAKFNIENSSLTGTIILTSKSDCNTFMTTKFNNSIISISSNAFITISNSTFIDSFLNCSDYSILNSNSNHYERSVPLLNNEDSVICIWGESKIISKNDHFKLSKIFGSTNSRQICINITNHAIFNSENLTIENSDIGINISEKGLLKLNGGLFDNCQICGLMIQTTNKCEISDFIIKQGELSLLTSNAQNIFITKCTFDSPLEINNSKDFSFEDNTFNSNFTIKNSNVTIKNSKFSNGDFGINLESGSLILDECNFDQFNKYALSINGNCSMKNITILNSNIGIQLLSNGLLTSNLLKCDKNKVAIINEGQIQIKNSSFSNSSLMHIDFHDQNLTNLSTNSNTIENSKFEEGGENGIFLSDFSIANIKKCEFINEKVAIVAKGILIMSESKINNCEA